MMMRQGDVFLRQLTNLPIDMPTAGKRIRPRRAPGGSRLVLADGEATGHSHSVVAEDAELVRLGNRVILQVLAGDGTTLDHLHDLRSPTQDHRPIRLQPGAYEVIIQREYVPATARMPARTAPVRD